MWTLGFGLPWGCDRHVRTFPTNLDQATCSRIWPEKDQLSDKLQNTGLRPKRSTAQTITGIGVKAGSRAPSRSKDPDSAPLNVSIGVLAGKWWQLFLGTHDQGRLENDSADLERKTDSQVCPERRQSLTHVAKQYFSFRPERKFASLRTTSISTEAARPVSELFARHPSNCKT